MEVPVLQTEVELRTDREIALGKQLPCELAVAVPELVNAGIASTDTDAPAETGLAAEIGPSVDHPRPDVRRSVDIKVGQRGTRTTLDRAEERGVELVMFNFPVLEADLAFQPEHPEVIAADEVGID